MTVLPNWSTFRHHAAVRVTASPTATFQNLNPDKIIRTDFGGDYAADGLKVGMVVRPSGTASNDARRFTIDVVSAAFLTLSADDAVVAEGPIGCTLTAFFIDPDGVEQYPGPFGDTNKVRSGGFDGGFSGVPTPYGGVAFEVTVNATAADSVYGVHEYRWYLSQRTDDSTKQYLSIASKTPTEGNTYSGTMSIVHSTLAYTDLGPGLSADEFKDAMTPDLIIEIFRHCHLYCQRISDGSLQWVDLLKAMIQGA